MRIADHIENAEPVGKHVYKALRADGKYAAIHIFPFQLSAEQYQFFEEQLNRLKKAVSEYRASIPRLLNWGFTITGGFPFIELEWIEGYDLADLKQREKAIPLEEIGKIATEISGALTHCHNLGVVHGNINMNSILWDAKHKQYVLTGFQLGLQPVATVPPKTSSVAVIIPGKAAQPSSQQNDVHDLGMVLLQLLTGRTATGAKEDLSALRFQFLPGEWTDNKKQNESQVPAWLASCITRSITNSKEERFEHAGQFYSYVLLHHKTPLQKKEWYRSKPQQSFPCEPKPPLKRSPVSLKNLSVLLPVGIKKKAEEMRFVFDRNIAMGLIIAALLAGFSIYAQKKETEAKRKMNRMQTSETALNPDTSYTIQSHDMPDATPVIGGKEKKKSKTEDTAGTTKKAQAVPKMNPPVKEQEEQPTGSSTDLGVYKVRSRAYFHSSPDETTRRNAFIVHWNNALLHPLKEENGFVYIVFINDEGQTSKGWIKKTDLLKQ